MIWRSATKRSAGSSQRWLVIAAAANSWKAWIEARSRRCSAGKRLNAARTDGGYS